MSDVKKLKKNDPIAHKSTVMPSSETVIFTSKGRKATEGKDNELTLEETNFKSRTRNSMYAELSKEDKLMTDEDYYEFAPFFKRRISLIIDCVFIFFLVKTVIYLAPFSFKAIYLFLDKYQLELWVSDITLMKTLIYIESFLIMYFLIVIPLAFFNTSLGKKIMKLRVRGDERYTLSITQAFQRELVYKPLSLMLVVGVLMPFFDKKKKSFHDKMTGTFVIND